MSDPIGSFWIDTNMTTTIETKWTYTSIQEKTHVPLMFTAGSPIYGELTSNSRGLHVYSVGSNIEVLIPWTRKDYETCYKIKIKYTASGNNNEQILELENNGLLMSKSFNSKDVYIKEINRLVRGDSCYQWSSAIKPIYLGQSSLTLNNSEDEANSVDPLAYSLASDSKVTKGSINRFLINYVQPYYIRWDTITDYATAGESGTFYTNRTLAEHGSAKYWNAKLPETHLVWENFSVRGGSDSQCEDLFPNNMPNIKWNSETSVTLGTKTFIVPAGTKVWFFRRTGNGRPTITKALPVTFWDVNKENNPMSLTSTSSQGIVVDANRTSMELRVLPTYQGDSSFTINFPIKMAYRYSSYSGSSSSWYTVTDSVPSGAKIRTLLNKVSSLSYERSYQAGYMEYYDKATATTKIASGTIIEDTGEAYLKIGTRSTDYKSFTARWHATGYTLAGFNTLAAIDFNNHIDIEHFLNVEKSGTPRQGACYMTWTVDVPRGWMSTSYNGVEYSVLATSNNQVSSWNSSTSKTIPNSDIASNKLEVATGKALTKKWALYALYNSNVAAFNFVVKFSTTHSYAFAIFFEFPDTVTNRRAYRSLVADEWGSSMMGESGESYMSVPAGTESGYTLTTLTGGRGMASKSVSLAASYDGFYSYKLSYECAGGGATGPHEYLWTLYILK